MKPYYEDESVTLYCGDALDVLRTMPDQDVDCIVTSPPYFGLRDYGSEGQYGLEASPAEYVETMRAVLSEARRVLADDGTLWLNIGDSYYSGRGASTGVDEKNPARRFGVRSLDKGGASWASPKNLLGIPWRVALALQDDGWILRNDIIWNKPNGMPESVNDRLATKHEHLFMFSKSPRYWFDLDPIREVHAETSLARAGRNRFTADRSQEGVGTPHTAAPQQAIHEGGKNPGDVWTIASQPFAEAHFAVMPPELARRAVLAGCKTGGTVLDPFSGSGTTGLVAQRNGRKYIGIDLSADYLDMSLRTRLQQGVLDFGEETA